ncbi:ROK family protein [Candidatus Woesearchaeota archaeon]|nr:ROK family protein [Candidatus Woesearchaeota archaeon]
MVVIALDIGGTKIKAAIVSPQQKILKSIVVPTRRQKGKTYVLNTIDVLIQGLLAGKENITAIGISVPGIIRPDGKQLFAGNALSFLEGINLKNRLEKKFELPVVIANDADCFALAEATITGFPKASKVLGVIWGTGLGAGIVKRKNKSQWSIVTEPLEIGQTLVVHPHTKKLVRQEMIVGGAYMLKEYNTTAKDKAGSVSDIYTAKNKQAKDVMQNAIEHLGKTLGNLVTILQPDVIVLGGGVSRLPQPVYTKLKTLMKKYALPTCYTGVQFKRHTISADAGLLGAAILARQLR